LTKLTDLSLYSNKIQVLEGLDNNHELEILSVGENKLQSLDASVKYLKKLKNCLKVLRINGNKFEETSDKKYGPYCISYLNDLIYLDYKLIDAVEREHAMLENKELLDEFVDQ